MSYWVQLSSSIFVPVFPHVSESGVILFYMWKDIGKKLREARDRKKLTQEQVAKQADITGSYYARIERGEENPSLEVLKKLSKALNVKSSEIFPF